MILLHKITTYILAVLVAAGFSILIYKQDYILLVVVLWFAVFPILFARLLSWEARRLSFWVFLCTPVFLLASSLFFFLFLEEALAKFVLAIAVTIAIWLYTENIFTFFHVPRAYQAYALEYLSLMIYIAGGFFFTSGAYGSQLFLQLPIWIPSLAVFLVVLFATIGVFWVSKIDIDVSSRFAIVGAVIMTEIYATLAMLPTSYLTNAAVFSIILYSYLGLSRVHVLEKLSKTVLRRYVVISLALLLIVFGTAKWI